MKKLLLRLLCSALLLGFVFSASAEAVEKLSGETKRTVTTLYKGVTQTYIETPSTSAYKSQKINIVEFDLAQRDLYFDVVYGRDTAYSLEGTTKTAENFTAETNKTAIAAVNGDLWMVTYAHARVVGSGTAYGGYKDEVVKKSLTVSRGFNISDGEIYTTAHIPQETPFEGEFQSFGVTDDFVPVLGNPYAEITLKNKTKNTTTTADGINRLPANNALIMYTDRVMGGINNFALDDAFEIVVEFPDDYKICHGTDITGKVVGIYDSSTSANPGTISNKQIVFTARGNRTSRISSYSVGDSIELTVNIEDKEGNADMWQRVTNAVGGHIQFVDNGILTGVGPGAGYPATIVGYTKEKKMMFITVDGRGANGSTGTSSAVLSQLAKDTGLYNAFILDGGGSTTMTVSVDGTNYKIVNTPSDKFDNGNFGCPRSVINSIIVSHGAERAPQGEFEIADPTALDIDPLNLTFGSKAMIDACFTGNNECSVSYKDECAVLTALVASGNNDAFTAIPYNSFTKSVSADTYKYLVFTYMLPKTNKNANYTSQLFLCSGTNADPAEARSKKVSLKKDGKFNSTLVDLSSASYWKGNISTIRFDFFVSASDKDEMHLYSFCLAKTKAEAQKIATEMAAKANNEPETTTAPETEAPETKAPETQAPETQAPETKAPETTTPETKAPDTTVQPETTIPETTARPETTVQTPVTEPQTTASATASNTDGVSVTAEPSDPTTEGNTEKPTEKNNTNWALIGIIAAVVVLAAVLVFILIPKKRK